MAASHRIWPSIWRSTEVYNPALRSARAAAFRAYHSSHGRKQPEQIPQRYGTANEPPPHLGGGKGLGPPSRKAEEQQQAKALPKIGERLQKDGEEEVRSDEVEAKAEEKEVKQQQQQREPATVEGKGKVARPTGAPMLDSSEAVPTSTPPGAPDMPEAKPKESVLNAVPSPDKQAPKEGPHAEEHDDKTFDEHSPPIKAPHIDQPRHIHHFDTYGLVKRVTEGGWDQKQSITIMKAVRLMLADNTDLAKTALVSKSQLENEAYLFKAACAELKTEITARRKSEQEKMRTERTQLQHEVDILSQRLGQESAALKDDLKGMFDDRKMAVRNEQRDMESKVQQLNYKITIMLQADAKSDVEGLRWVMTRRVIITLGCIVFMVLSSLKAAKDVYAAEEAGSTSSKGKKGSASSASGGGGGAESDELARQIANGEVVVVKEGDNPGFVSLG
ncbi:hypothetical protein LTR37_013084 [Vermiconidia calcicola]|uniref:Uncharacterized protein n=1 Tax=Vermiconidia calcicola TaxID=1690605 RepID=A0ACC3MXW6_9PEZI|nr:hypothetical protein LTR37_013084 [Vermiconidia calcicola]